VYNEARTVLRAAVTDFSFKWCLEIPSDNRESTMMRRDVYLKRSSISMFEVEAVRHSCIP
jgi:hypothetical protein